MAGCAAQQHARAASDDDDQHAQAFSTYLSARFAAGEHDLPQAARYYGQSLTNDPGNPSLLALSFFYSTTSGDFDAAGKYAQAVVAATPDDRAARLALAVIGFKHKDYADVRKQLSLSAKGPFTVLTLSLFDAWAAAAQHDTAGMEKDLAALAEQKGAESMAAFHTALLQEYLGNAAAADAAYKKALASDRPHAAGAGGLWPFPGTPGARRRSRQALSVPYQRRRPGQRDRARAWRASRPARSRKP